MHLASLYSEWCPDSTIPGVFLVQNSSEHSSALENKGAVSTRWERANLPGHVEQGQGGWCSEDLSTLPGISPPPRSRSMQSCQSLSHLQVLQWESSDWQHPHHWLRVRLSPDYCHLLSSSSNAIVIFSPILPVFIGSCLSNKQNQNSHSFSVLPRE